MNDDQIMPDIESDGGLTDVQAILGHEVGPGLMSLCVVPERQGTLRRDDDEKDEDKLLKTSFFTSIHQSCLEKRSERRRFR